MARIRTIKPEFFQHSELYDAEKATGMPLRVAYPGLWCQCDKAGRFRWKPRELKLAILPYDDVDMVEVLKALVDGGFVGRYTVSGIEYGFVVAWSHQRPSNREQESQIPPPPKDAKRAKAQQMQCHDTAQDVPRDGKGCALAPANGGWEGEGNGEGEGEGKGPAFSIAASWCFRLARKKNGYPADRPDDIAAEVGEMIRTGMSGAAIQAEVDRAGRDCSEHFWELKKRMRGGGSAPSGETTREKLARLGGIDLKKLEGAT